VHEQLLTAEILVIATPTWLGQPSSVSKQVLERMGAMIFETDDNGTPVAYNRVAWVRGHGRRRRSPVAGVAQVTIEESAAERLQEIAEEVENADGEPLE
jgi:multimeric flavodoxin WrbA